MSPSNFTKLNRLFFFFSTLLLCVLSSCKDKSPQKIKDLDSIRSKSNYQPKKDTVIEENKLDTLLPFYNQEKVDLGFIGIEKDTNDYLLNEFSFNSSEQLKLIDSKQQVVFHRYWKFKTDSNLVKNTFYNWFDREFSQRNADVRIYSRLKLNRNNLIFFCTNQSIHIITSTTPLNLEKWVKFIQNTERKVSFVYICHQLKNKDACWYSLKDNQFILIPAV